MRRTDLWTDDIQQMAVTDIRVTALRYHCGNMRVDRAYGQTLRYHGGNMRDERVYGQTKYRKH